MGKSAKPLKLKKILPYLSFDEDVHIYLANDDITHPIFEGMACDTPYYLLNCYLNSCGKDFGPISPFIGGKNGMGLELFVTDTPDFRLENKA